MKRRIVILMAGILVSASIMTACGKKNEATKASAESEETEKEGSGESVAAPEEQETPEEEIKPQIAVFLPGSSVDRRWRMEADVFRKNLGDKGYQVMLRYATGNVKTQEEQIRSICAQSTPAKALIIAPVDPWELTEELAEAVEKKIAVFAYDDLIMNTDALSYYVTFDHRHEGQLLGEKIAEMCELDKKQENGEKTSIRFYSFTPETTGELFLYNGLMEKLEPYLESGVLTETRTNPEVICTLDGEDGLQAAEQLEKRGHLPTDEDWPLIFTVSNDSEVIRNIASGRITGTFFCDGRTLAASCADTVLTYLSDETPEVSDYQQYDNGLRLVRSIVTEPEYADQDDYKKLVDSGYFTEQEIMQ